MPGPLQSKRQIFIREVGVREGVQSFPGTIATEDKLALIDLLNKANFPEIEVTAMVRPDKVPSMADSDAVISGLPKRDKGVYSALYLNDKGFLRSKAFSNIQTDGWMQASVSETFLLKNSNQNFSQFLAGIGESIRLFTLNNSSLFGIMLSNSFGCNYEGDKTDEDVSKVLTNILKECRNAGTTPKYVVLADTTGRGTPGNVEATIKRVQQEFSDIKVGLHLHDTRGMGMANAHVGLSLGVDYFDSSIVGVGGCPFTPNATGNIASEELIYLCESMGFETGINQEYLKAAGELALKIFQGKTSSRIALTW